MFTFSGNHTPCWSFPEKPKRFCFRLFPHGIICSVSNTPYVFVFLYGRKRRFACRTLRTGSNICFRQIVRRPASICCSCARLSTNFTCTWKPDRTTKNCRTWVRKRKSKNKMATEKSNIYVLHFMNAKKHKNTINIVNIDSNYIYFFKLISLFLFATFSSESF